MYLLSTICLLLAIIFRQWHENASLAFWKIRCDLNPQIFSFNHNFDFGNRNFTYLFPKCYCLRISFFIFRHISNKLYFYTFAEIVQIRGLFLSTSYVSIEYKQRQRHKFPTSVTSAIVLTKIRWKYDTQEIFLGNVKTLHLWGMTLIWYNSVLIEIKILISSFQSPPPFFFVKFHKDHFLLKRQNKKPHPHFTVCQFKRYIFWTQI